jgi:hypothetical protein
VTAATEIRIEDLVKEFPTRRGSVTALEDCL